MVNCKYDGFHAHISAVEKSYIRILWEARLF